MHAYTVLYLISGFAILEAFSYPSANTQVRLSHAKINVPDSPASNSINDNITTLITFDDIRTRDGIADVPSPYHALNFSSAYWIVAPTDPALDGYISDHDLNAAVSPPNALIGSRFHPDDPSEDTPASFFLGASTAAREGLEPYFDLDSFYVKPLDAPAPGVWLFVRGYPYDDDREPLTWSVEFVVGYHEPFLVKIEEYSRAEWRALGKVEMWAQFGVQRLDWEFCVDDLRVRFHEAWK
ncbi:MAG: hypothetical protein M1819_005838 [Sarea resinae]|nr:MAG: hypothetical protein M1819_005838 [Sarea resinae]